MIYLLYGTFTRKIKKWRHGSFCPFEVQKEIEHQACTRSPLAVSCCSSFLRPYSNICLDLQRLPFVAAGKGSRYGSGTIVKPPLDAKLSPKGVGKGTDPSGIGLIRYYAKAEML